MSSIWSRLINLAGNITGTLGVANGGTGLATGVDGSVLAFTGTGTLNSSSLLTNHAVMIGGGTGSTPKVISVGTTGQLLVGATGADPAFGSTVGAATTFSAGAVLGGTTTAASGASGTQTNLNWHEVGTWTPAMAGSSGAASSVTAVGTFTRIGNIVHVFAQITFNKNSLAGGLSVTGLPYSSPATSNINYPITYGAVAGIDLNTATTGVVLVAKISASSSSIALQTVNFEAGTAAQDLVPADLATTTILQLAGIYPIS